MCGLVGLFDTRGQRPVDRALLTAMNDRLVHRGPDGSGIFTEAGIGLGHRRLAIIDVAGGAQPVFNEDETVAVVFNGEIFNFMELIALLTGLGHRFRTRCDTEVIVHAWEEWGPACVERFRGMFAFALWDSRTKTLFLARDRLGIKPLYYALLPDGWLIFASELKGLLAHPQLSRAMDASAVEDYFAYGYVPDPKTIYSACAKLPPAHRLAVGRSPSPTEPRPEAYWDVRFAATVTDGTRGAEELIERLREAVRIRLVSEVPLGAFLSGGLDSSTIVALMAELMAEPVQTCSIAFAEADYDESSYAAQVAARYGADHQSHVVRADDFSLLEALARAFDEPFADNSAMPTYQVCGLARRRVTVCLSGDGGDELFAGYRRYRFCMNEERVRSRLPAGLRSMVFGRLARVYPKLDWAPQRFRAKTTLEALARDSAEGYFHAVCQLTDGLRAKLFSTSFRRDLQGYRASDVLRRYMESAPTDHPLSRLQYADLKTYLAGDILTKVDRMSMAHSLEVRVPFLDHPFVEWSASLAADLKLHGGQGKHILKRAVGSRLPPEIVHRRKQGFSIPVARWFRGPLRDRVHRGLTEGPLADSGYFDMGFITHALAAHQSGVADHSVCLWSLFAFGLFLDHVHAGERQPPAVSPLAVAAGGRP
jgi:asparagine synthase (glutamine-hydrolysing)